MAKYKAYRWKDLPIEAVGLRENLVASSLLNIVQEALKLIDEMEKAEIVCNPALKKALKEVEQELTKPKG